jgi:PAS domain S-box-containing protein
MRDSLIASLIESVTDAVVVLDESGCIALHNQAAEALFPGIEDGRGVADWGARYGLCQPDGVTPYAERDLPFQRARSGESADNLEILIRPTGRRLLARVRPAVGGLGILAFRDITAETELRDAQEKLRSILNNAPVTIWAHDMEGRVQFLNPAAERMFGWTEAEVLGKKLPIIPESQQEDFEGLLAQYREGFAPHGVERRRQKRGGEPIDIAFWGTPLRDAHGEIVAQLGIVLDVTANKQMEERLRQAQKMESVGQLAGGVAHDFNNLLTVINGYSDLVLAALRREDPLHRSVAAIRQAGEQAASLTQQLLAFSRRQVLAPHALDLNSILLEMEDMLRRLAGEGVRLTNVRDADLGCVMADSDQMHQVLINLVVNARDAMPDGGEIVIETANIVVTGNYTEAHPEVKPGPYVVVAISDTGQGMDEHTQQRIFEPFFTTKEKGTGLGLATVYGIVRQSEGWIWVYSEPGKGTTFKIYLPRIDAAPEERDSAVRNPSTGGSETILLVEDQEEVRQIAKVFLANNGYRVLEAASGEDAIALARAYPGAIDLIVTDVVLPGMNGRALAEMLTETRPRMRVLYVSGYTSNVIADRGILDQDVAYLAKPFTSEALAAKVRETLDRQAAGGPDELV